MVRLEAERISFCQGWQRFQFQYGAIRSVDCAVEAAVAAACFNSSMVQLEVSMVQKRIKPDASVSIPIWCD